MAGSRVGLSWARPRHYGGRSRHRKFYIESNCEFQINFCLGSPSPSYRRSNRDSYSSRRRYSR